MFANLTTQHDVCDGRSHEDRRQGTYHYTEAHGEGEAADALSTEEEYAEQHDQCRERGVDGTCQRLVDRVVEQLLEVLLRVELEVLTNTVEHHHLVVDRVANHCQHSSDERQVDLH